MRKLIYICAVLCIVFPMQEAFASQYHYDWECADNYCTFSANPISGVLAYEWNFGDITYASDVGQNVDYTYDWPGSGTMTTRVTLSYHMVNGLYYNVRCYITWYEPGVGPPIGPEIFQGTCEGFN